MLAGFARPLTRCATDRFRGDPDTYYYSTHNVTENARSFWRSAFSVNVGKLEVFEQGLDAKAFLRNPFPAGKHKPHFRDKRLR